MRTRLTATLMFILTIGWSAAALGAPDLRPPREVLTGHWRDGAGKLNYYFSADRVTMIDGEQMIGEYPFEIVEENKAETWIRIKLKADDASERMIRIDFKRKGFMETFKVQGVTLNNIMLYVDAKQAP